MQRRQFVSHVLAWGFAGAGICGVPGCGVLLYSERCGQPHSNQIDWKVVALDGLGLLLFFVPGVIAFVVDFASGAIYLPLETSYLASPVVPPPPSAGAQEASNQHSAVLRPANAMTVTRESSVWQRLGLRRVAIPREQLQPQRIEQIVTQYVGRRVSLDDNQTRVSVLPCLERFDEQASRHRSDRSFGFAVQSFFERLKHRAA